MGKDRRDRDDDDEIPVERTTIWGFAVDMLKAILLGWLLGLGWGAVLFAIIGLIVLFLLSRG